MYNVWDPWTLVLWSIVTTMVASEQSNSTSHPRCLLRGFTQAEDVKTNNLVYCMGFLCAIPPYVQLKGVHEGVYREVHACI